MARKRPADDATPGVMTLEVLNARFGDALLLHYPRKKGDGLVVIDGGPAGTYGKVIRNRLDELREPADGPTRPPLPIRLLLVTHIDADHIAGVLELARDFDKKLDDQSDKLFQVESFWHNSFEKLVGKVEPVAPRPGKAAAASLADSLADLDAMLGHEASAEASVKQGMELRDIARKRNWTNREFEGLVTMPGEDPRTIDLDGLKLTVLGPNQERIDKLQADWAEALRKKDRAEAAALIADEKLDTSVTNLSSIIVLAEFGGRRMLLTGDALGLHVIDGLRHAKLLDRDGRYRVDLLKLPHHGSDRNNNPELFRTILADHYVVSADGRHGNPDLATFRALVEARGDDVYTIHVTNDHDDSNKPLVAVEFLRDQQKDGRRFRLNVLPKGQASFVIDPSAATETKPAPKAAKPAKPKTPKRPKATRPKRSG